LRTALAGQQCDVSQLDARMLERAAHLLGGTEELANYLGVSAARLRIWMRGLIAPPADVFLKLADLICDPPPRQHPPRRRARN